MGVIRIFPPLVGRDTHGQEQRHVSAVATLRRRGRAVGKEADASSSFQIKDRLSTPQLRLPIAPGNGLSPPPPWDSLFPGFFVLCLNKCISRVPQTPCATLALHHTWKSPGRSGVMPPASERAITHEVLWMRVNAVERKSPVFKEGHHMMEDVA